MDCRSLVSRWSAGLARAFRGIAFVGVSIVGIGVPVPIAFAQSAPLSTQPPPSQTPREARLREIDAVIAKGPYADTWASLERQMVPEWYRDAKFGIFIHWGVYSVPAFGNEWYPRNMYLAGTPEFAHHVKTFGAQSKFGYKDFIPQFKAERFDPAAWADLFSKAGARFVVPVAEHHDGFAMYDSAWSDWTAAKMGPKRDCIGLLAGAVRAKGMTLGVSSHRAEHWWYFEGGRRFDSDVKDPNNAGLYAPAEPESAPPSKAFCEDWLLRSCELVDKYSPQLVWFDWWIEQPAMEAYRRKFAAYYYDRAGSLGMGVAINYKNAAFPERAAVLDLERGQLGRIRAGFWQTDTSISKSSWGHVEPQDYKTALSIVGDLADIVSKNGALLLNIGPKADGTIPEAERAILLEIGDWLLVNADAIYATRPFHVFGEGPTSVPEGSFTDTARPPYTAEDIRYTTKNDLLYAIVMGWPTSGRVMLRALASDSQLCGGTVSGVRMLGREGALRFERGPEGLLVELPEMKPRAQPFALEIAGLTNLEWDGKIRPGAGGAIVLRAGDATVAGAAGRPATARYESGNGRDNIGFWNDPNDRVSFEFLVSNPGTYEVRVEAACAPGTGGRYQLSAGAQTLEATARDTGGWTRFEAALVGKLVFAKGGAVTLTVKPLSEPPWRAMNLKEIVLRPVP
jgi:alpha-L-fucosidase